jgi:hypothetical protein
MGTRHTDTMCEVVIQQLDFIKEAADLSHIALADQVPKSVCKCVPALRGLRWRLHDTLYHQRNLQNKSSDVIKDQ